MQPWEKLATAQAPDGTLLELRRRGHEYLILAGGHDLMSSEDDVSSKALAELGCAHIIDDRPPARDRARARARRAPAPARVLVGGLGMGYTLRAALDHTGPTATVEVAELVPAVAEWNRGALASLANHPLDDPRTSLQLADVGARIRAARSHYDAILLDVDNGPDALAHPSNEALYSRRGVTEAWTALRPGGVLGVWSFSDEPRFTARLERQGFATHVHRISASRKGRGRYHFVWIARRP